jgi:hypothetical protein
MSTAESIKEAGNTDTGMDLPNASGQTAICSKELLICVNDMALDRISGVTVEAMWGISSRINDMAEENSDGLMDLHM